MKSKYTNVTIVTKQGIYNFVNPIAVEVKTGLDVLYKKIEASETDLMKKTKPLKRR